MGKIDTVAKEYMSNPIHFADAFNYLFDGTQVISSECLQEKDTTELGIFYDNGQEETTQKIRDVLRQCIIMEDETSY